MTGFFSDGSPFLSHPLLTEERTRQEIDFLIQELGLSTGARILDVGCGFGRHSVELARRGYAVTGIDPAGAMIQAARRLAAAANVQVDFRQTAGELFHDPQPYDAALCLFTTLGQMGPNSDEDNQQLLPQIAASLRPGGRFALEAPQRAPTLAALKPTERFGNEHTFTEVRRSYHALQQVVTEQFRLTSPAGEQVFLLRYRLYSQGEVADMLEKAGFQITAAYAGYRPIPLAEGSPVMLFLCSRR